MTEQEWLISTDPKQMRHFLRGEASDRKLRLFAVSCCATLERVLCDEALNLLDVSERFADGQADAAQLAEARRAAKTPVMANTGNVMHLRDQESQIALHACVLAAWGKVDAARPVAEIIDEVIQARRYVGYKNALFEFASLFRDIFGNPFRPTSIDSSCRAWKDGTIPKIAQTIYEERRFADLPILADALDEAGSTNAEIQIHCRSEGPHVRGCWVVDLILGKQ